ncbi:hypothetical protein B4114_3081 [Geobacillus stearothermophilus]|uniref:Uncharacterized protein n=1 Tax=Geobacillus stearothermophilus TaxID=1422 RepID=A0A150NBJ4_GEOSE|nr:hypothetical protein B4114_3081 [Geobacillus stearothermophilus]
MSPFLFSCQFMSVNLLIYSFYIHDINIYLKMELPPFRNVDHRFERRLSLQTRKGRSPAISGS